MAGGASRGLIQGFAGEHDQGLDASRIELTALSPDITRQMGSATAKLVSLLHNTLGEGIRTGKLRRDLNVELTTALIMRTASAAREQLPHGEHNAQELADATLALLLGGIQAIPPTTAR